MKISFKQKQSAHPIFSKDYRQNLSSFSFFIPADKLNNGDYILKAEAFDSHNKMVSELEQVIHKLPPAPVIEVIARNDKILLLNGKSFFPIGICVSDGNKHFVKGMQEYTTAGFNLFLVPLDNNFLQEASKYNAKVLAVIQKFHVPISQEEWIKKAKQLFDKHKSNSALIGYFIEDEAMWGGKPVSDLRKKYEYYRMQDPYRLVMANEAPRNEIANLIPYTTYSDVGCVDIYPVPEGCGHSEFVNQTISCVGEYVDKTQATVNNEKPTWIILQGFAWADNPGVSGKGIYPTWEESRFMAYDAIIHGATGIIYWGLEVVAKPSFLRDLFRVTSELREMSTVFMGRTINDSTICVNSTNIVFQHKICDNDDYLIAANESKETITAKWTTPFREKKVFVAFENRQVKLLNGAFNDVFKPNEVHVYSTTGSKQKLNPIAEIKFNYLEGLAGEKECIGKMPFYKGNAKWIWWSPIDRTRGFLRRTFSLPEPTKSAKVLVTADGNYVLYINGIKVNTTSMGWNTVGNYDVRSFLKEGDNVFAVEVEDLGSGAFGFLLDFSAETFSGQTISFVSDESWQTSKSKSQGWQQAEYQAKEWQKASVIAPYGSGAWGIQVKVKTMIK